MSRYNQVELLVAEEQLILDELIEDMTEVGANLDKKLKKYILEAKKAKENLVPEAYGCPKEEKRCFNREKKIKRV